MIDNRIIFILILASLITYSCNPPPDQKATNSTQKTTPIIYKALEDFEFVPKENRVPFYKDSLRHSLAINAELYKNKFSKASLTFSGFSGNYDIKLTTVKETDGESTYIIGLDGKQIGAFQNPTTGVDFETHTFSLPHIKLEKGQTIHIEFNSHSNEKIPEGEGFAFSRGRWTKIEFYPVE